ncbi:calcium-binding protein [Aromatoleum evansii]|uniref:Calcium-binding protein n=1 Tax=Aromatoleum evansii TaxID=59406 RepID=A0ABZ1AG11_AROEV|nr:calcium-binding protein [Aromatoleum evansii]
MATYTGTPQADSLKGGVGDDQLWGRDGNDTLDGGAGNDTLYGEMGNDTLRGGNGNDLLDGGSGADNMAGGTGNDTYVVDNAADVVTESLNQGTDTVLSSVSYALGANLENLSLTGAENLNATGNTAANVLTGNAGNNILDGKAGADQLDGGAGNDTLLGGTGNDTYLFGRGDGVDTISDSDTTAGNVDTIRFEAGITPQDVQLYRDSASNLYLVLGGTGDRVVVSGWFASVSNRVEQVQFADGTTWNADVLAAAAFAIEGSAFGEGLNGNGSANLILGRDGDDVLSGQDGNDLLLGEGGKDTLFGGAGNDAMEGGAGNDVLRGDWGADVLNGGQGDDFLGGDGGSDTYVFNRGDGQDTIYDFEDWRSTAVDTLAFGAGIKPGDVTLTRIGTEEGSLKLSINGSTDSITVANWFIGTEYRIEQVTFADGSVWDTATLAAAPWEVLTAPIVGTDNGEILHGRNGGDETLEARGGNDLVYGYAGNDVLRGEAGNDTLYGGAGNDAMEGGEGNDVLYGDYDAVAGADTLNGGLGNDTLAGGEGADTYLFNLGDGQDFIDDYADWRSTAVDTIAFGAGIDPADVTILRPATATNQLKLVINGTSDSITVHNWFLGLGNRIEQVTFADGTVWNTDFLAAAPIAIDGTEGNDTLQGDAANNLISGLGGDDALYGHGGADQLDGGAGNDTLDGGAGADTLKGGDGDDRYIVDNVGDVVIETVPVAAPGTTAPAIALISRDGTGDQLAATFEGRIGVSADGRYVVFGAQYAGSSGIVLKDTESGALSYIASGSEKSISADGRYVVFSSADSTLVAGDTNGTDDIFVKDTQTGQVVRVSTSVTGEEANSYSEYAQISADGKYVAFVSSASNLVAGDTNGEADVFRKNLETGEVVRLSDTPAGTDGNSYVGTVTAISDDGRFVTFESRSSNLVDGDTNNTSDVFLADAELDTVIRVSTTSSGAEGNDSSGYPEISADGRYVVFDSDAQLVEGDTPDTADIFRKDTVTGEVLRVSTSFDGSAHDYGNYIPDVSADGRFVVFQSSSTRLVAGDTNAAPDIFVKDMLTGELARVSVSATGEQANSWSNSPKISADGRFITFVSDASNLVEGDSNAGVDLFQVANPFLADIPESHDVVEASISYSLTDQVENLVLTGTASIDGTGNALDNEIVGNAAANTLLGAGGDDVLRGGAGNDLIVGADGVDILEGGSEQDILGGADNHDAMFGGTGSDHIYLYQGDVVAGGAGVDWVNFNEGADVALFNRGDGADMFVADGAAQDTLSLGTGISYSDLALRRDADNLILDVGAGESITLLDWYVPANLRSVANLQVIAEAMAGFDAAGADPLLDNKVEQFDFAGLATRFDQEMAANPALTSWNLSSALLEFHVSGSDTAAIGGDLAYQYGKNGTLAGIGVGAAQSVLGDAQFGVAAQTLQPLAQLQEGVVKLS